MIASIWRAGKRFADVLNSLADEGEAIYQEIRAARESREPVLVQPASEPPKIQAEPAVSRRRSNAN